MAAKKARRTMRRSRKGKKLLSKRSARAQRGRRTRAAKVKRPARKVAKKVAKGARRAVRKAAAPRRRAARKVEKPTARPIQMPLAGVTPVTATVQQPATPAASGPTTAIEHSVQSAVDDLAEKFGH